MRRVSVSVLVGLALLMTAGGAAVAGPEIGIAGNAPVDGAGTVSWTVDPATVHATGAKWVRINFLLGPWSSPHDPTLHGGKTWGQAFDGIVNGILAKGMKVYGLVGAESVGDPGDLLRAWPGPDPDAAEAWVHSYAEAFVAIVDRFKDRVRVFESYNEPNDWAGGHVSKIHPRWFAYLLQHVYLNVKHFNGHAGDPAWQVTLVSGPLFTHDDDDGAAYLSSTYDYGRTAHAWDWTRAETGSFPLDGIGAHLYVVPGTVDPPAVRDGMDANLEAMWEVVTANEGAGTAKRFWLSEVGWTDAAVGEDGQAANVTTALAHLKGDARVRLVTWFCVADWPGEAWGVLRSDGSKKPAYAAFQAQAGPPAGALPSKTHGAGPAAFGIGKRTEAVTAVATWRAATRYWGVQGIDAMEAVTDAAGTKYPCAVGWHAGDRVEYKMTLGGAWTRLQVYGLADVPGPVLVRVHVDGVARGTLSLNAGTGKFQTRSLLLSGIAYGTHAVCLEFLNDFYTGPGDGDRNLYVGALRVVKP